MVHLISAPLQGGFPGAAGATCRTSMGILCMLRRRREGLGGWNVVQGSPASQSGPFELISCLRRGKPLRNCPFMLSVLRSSCRGLFGGTSKTAGFGSFFSRAGYGGSPGGEASIHGGAAGGLRQVGGQGSCRWCLAVGRSGVLGWGLGPSSWSVAHIQRRPYPCASGQGRGYLPMRSPG